MKRKFNNLLLRGLSSLASVVCVCGGGGGGDRLLVVC